VSIKVVIDYDEPIFPWYDYAHDTALAAGLADEETEPPTQWDPTTVYGCEQQDWYDAIDAEIEKGHMGMYARPIKPGVRAQLLRLKRRNIEIHVLTARGSFGPLGERIKWLTQAQIINEDLPIDLENVHFAKKKLPVLFDILGDEKKTDLFYLDDRTNYIEEAWLAGFYSSYLLDERWNQDAYVFEKNRVYSTRQFIDIVCARVDALVSV
jgi:hypothetical protein